MTNVSSVVCRFPVHELKIRRLYGSDPEFRDICEHYAVAIRAYEFWMSDDAKVREYRRLIKELEDELFEILEPTNTGKP